GCLQETGSLEVNCATHCCKLLCTAAFHGVDRCCVVTAQSCDEALVRLAETEAGRRPDVIVSDYQLSRGLTGIDAIERLRSAFPNPIPALLISGDASSPRCEVGSQGYHLLYKPVNAERLHAALVDAS